MTVKDFERLYDYNYWATGRLLGVVKQLTPEEFTKETAGAYGSVRNTLVHTLSAEWGWLDRCGGTKRGPMLKSEDFPTVDSVVATWARVEGYVREFLASLADADLQRTVEFKLPLFEQPRVMRIGDLLQHAANHGVHHRGQVALILRVLGHVPGNIDLLIYDSERQHPGT